MFKFLQRLEKSGVPLGAGEPAAIQDDAAPPDALARGGTFEGKTSSDFEPQARVLGYDTARTALARLAHSKPCSIHFVSAPRTSGHVKAIAGLLTEQVATLAPSDAVVVAQSFERDGGVQILRLPADGAQRLAASVADAIEMLSVTLAAAFDADSYKVASIALEEELRSGHDGAIDALKRRAQAQNIGILRTPQGYAVAPMHEGRVVSADVFKALPDGLKSDVEAKLAAFENELSGVLSERTTLQHDYWSRLRELDREVASLTVRAALGPLTKEFAKSPAAAAYLEALGSDLTRNAALFVSAHQRAQGRARAPIEIASDPHLARFRLNVLAAGGSSVTAPHGLGRASLCGVINTGGRGQSVPDVICPGALLSAGSGFVVIDARELMAHSQAWPLVKRTLQSGSAHPLEEPAGQVSDIAVPVAARVIVTGEMEDFVAWNKEDRDVARIVALVTAFEPKVALTAAIEREFASIVCAQIAGSGLQPFAGAAIAALMHERTDTAGGVPLLSTDLDALDEILVLADQSAKAQGLKVTEARDVLAALKQRADSLGILAAYEGSTRRGVAS